MPVVEKVSGGRVYVRAADRQFETGDRADVSEETAAYLVEERGDFERVDGGDGSTNDLGVDELRENVESGTVEDTGWVREALAETDDENLLADARELAGGPLRGYIEGRLIDSGKCPWCSEYEGDAVGQHATSVHPDEWDAYKEG